MSRKTKRNDNPAITSKISTKNNQMNYKKERVIVIDCHIGKKNIALILTRDEFFTKIQDDNEEHQSMLWVQGVFHIFHELRRIMEIY